MGNFDYQNYIKTELVILIPVLYIIGIGLKKSKIPDKLIPIILGVISVVLSAAWVFGTGDVNNIKECAVAFFTAVTQGITAAGTSVYAHQIYKQIDKEK